MKNKIIFLFLLTFLVLFIFWFLFGYLIKAPNLKTIKDRSFIELEIKEKKYQVEVVNSKESITLGLSGRKEIGSDGMLFIFSKPKYAVFWMKQMNFSLDFLWIKDNKIVQIDKNIPNPVSNVSLEELELYKSKFLVDKMLEVRAGFVENENIKVGDKVEFIF